MNQSHLNITQVNGTLGSPDVFYVISTLFDLSASCCTSMKEVVQHKIKKGRAHEETRWERIDFAKYSNTTHTRSCDTMDERSALVCDAHFGGHVSLKGLASLST